MTSSPTTTKKRLKRKQPEFLTQDELRSLLGVIKSKRDLAIFKVAYRHALRASEIGMLEIVDVNFKQARITIRRLKDSNGGVYPMSADTVKVLRSYLRTRKDDNPFLFISNRGTPIDRTTLFKLSQTYGERAGIPRKKQGFHILKHSICTVAAEVPSSKTLPYKSVVSSSVIEGTDFCGQGTNSSRTRSGIGRGVHSHRPSSGIRRQTSEMLSPANGR